MTVSLTTLYNRLGGHFGIAKTQLDARSGIVTRATNLDGQYTAATRYMYTPVLNQFLNIYNSTDATISAAIQGATKTLTEMVSTDNVNVPKSTLPALQELARQMRSGSTSLLQNTITRGSVSRTGTGTGTVVFADPSQMSRSELLQFECISDTTTGSAAGSEVFRVTGGAAYPNVNDSQWPGGTGINTTMASNDYVGGMNLLQNGSFETWTGGVPNNWTLGTGISSDIAQYVANPFRSSAALLLQNNATTVILAQNTGTQTLGPGKRVIFGMWVRRVSGTATQDVEMELQTSSGTGYATVTATAAAINSAGSTWTLYTGSYQHAWTAPIESATAIITRSGDSGVTVAVDCAFIFVPTQAGTNGQFFQIVSGGTDWRIGDRMTVQITNDYASSVLSYTERFFAPFANGIELPTSGSPTVNNSVIP
jgi:hypothetical protein